MTKERWNYMMSNKAWYADTELTPIEINQGWHFCFEFDGLLRNNNEEKFQCTCIKQLYWCNSHNRQCEKDGCDGYKEGYVTGPERYKGEILLPCFIVNLTGLVELENEK